MKKGEKQYHGTYVPLKIAVIYTLFSTLWILLSDQILYFMVKDPGIMTKIQMIKGWIFIFTSALIILFLLKKEFERYMQVEEGLRRSEKKYRTLFDSSTDAITLIDSRTNKFIDCNDAAVKLHDTGNRENFIGLRPDQLSPEYQTNGALSEILAAAHIKEASQEGAKVFEWIHCKSDGTQFPVIVTLNAIVLGDDKLVMSIAKDITYRRTAEEERERLINELREVLDNVRTLSGLLPICSNCNKIRDDKGYWNQIENYIEQHSDAEFSHGLCPACSDRLYGQEQWYKKMKQKRDLES